MDSPVSHSLADRERITMRSPSPPLLPLPSSFCRTARSPIHVPLLTSVRLSVHPIVSSSASCHSPRQPLPPASLFSSHRRNSSLLSCLLLFTHPPSPAPPPIRPHPSPSPKILPRRRIGSSTADRYRTHLVVVLHLHRGVFNATGTRTTSWTGGGGRREGREKGCWKRAELGAHRWSALGPLLGSGPIPRMPFTSRGPPVVVFLVLVVRAVILAIVSSSSSSSWRGRERERDKERRRGRLQQQASSIESFTAEQGEGLCWKKGRGPLQAERDNGQWGHKSA